MLAIMSLFSACSTNENNIKPDSSNLSKPAKAKIIAFRKMLEKQRLEYKSQCAELKKIDFVHKYISKQPFFIAESADLQKVLNITGVK